MLRVFGAPNRRQCTTARVRDNTPQQALTLLNEPCFLEAAAALARQMSDQMKTAATSRHPAQLAIVPSFRRCTSPYPSVEELAVLENLFETQRAQLRIDPLSAAEIISAHFAGERGDSVPVDLAAWFVVANTLLNLDATLTKG